LVFITLIKLSLHDFGYCVKAVLRAALRSLMHSLARMVRQFAIVFPEI
jgi:hypothetical protein